MKTWSSALQLVGLLLLLSRPATTSATAPPRPQPFTLIPTDLHAERVSVPIRQDLIDEYQVRSWDSTDGLPENHVDTVARDRQGYLWLSTWDGLCRFSGTEFVTFRPVNTPALRSETFSDLVVDRRGDLWAASKDGLYRINGGAFEYFGRECGLPSADLLSMEVGPAGFMWICTAAGLTRFDGTNVVNFPADPGRRFTQNIHFLPGGQALVFTAGEAGDYLYQFDPATGRFTAPPREFSPDGDVKRQEVIGPDRDNVLWLRTLGAVYQLFPDHTLRKFRDIPENMKGERVLLLCDSRGDIWMAGGQPGVLQRHSHAGTAEIDLEASRQITSFNDLVEEPGGIYWLCTGQGLVQLRERAVKNYSRRHGLLHDFIFSLARLGPDRALLGTRRWPAILDLGRMQITLFLLPGVNATSRSLLPDADGSFWVTDGEHGPTHVAADGAVSRSSLSAAWPFQDEQYVFYRDSKDRIWIADEAGVHIIRGDQVQFLTTNTVPAITGEGIRVIREMRDHSIWLGGRHAGIRVLSPDATIETARYTTSDGLSDNDVWCLETDEEGDVWAGTANGLNRIRNDVVQSLLPGNHLSEGVINQILRDNYGYLWLTGNKGIYRIDPREVSGFLDGSSNDFEVLSIDRDDGLINAETNGEQQPAGFVGDDGRLLIPTIAGVAIVDPTRFRSRLIPRPPLLEKIEMDNEVIYDAHPGGLGGPARDLVHRFAAGRGQLLRLAFAAPEVSMVEKAAFEVRLNGHEDRWRPIGRQQSILYTNLRPGDYSFDLRVTNHRGRTSRTATPFRFHLAAYPYQTTSFWLVLTVLALALAYGLHRWRLGVVSHIKQLEQRAALVSERERIARDMHDDLGSRLTHISLLADLTKRTGPQQSTGKLDELNAAAREAVRAVEEIVWSANPGNDTLASLTSYMTQFAGNVLEAASIRCRVDAASDWPDVYLSPEKRHSVYMAFKEALTNLLKHSRATEVSLSLHPHGREVQVCISDNGTGFDPAQVRQSGQDGLDNMNARMQKIGGGCRVESRPGSGTTVTLVFPWEPNT
jgi:signal transduction histidine kinase/ligand-binding sensor domain-containing protein